MIKEFSYLKKIDVREMSKKVNEMYEILEKMSSGEIPDDKNYTLKDLTGFCESLVKNQRNDIDGIKPYSWAVLPTAKGVPSDARVDFVFFPTYIAVSILTKFLLDYPDEAKKIPDYEKVLHNGFKFSTYRGLEGHGYEATSEMIKAIKILGMGNVPEYLTSNPHASPELLDILRNIKRVTAEALKTGNTKGLWNRDYREQFEFVLEVLKDI